MKAILVLLFVTRHGASKHLQCGSVTGERDVTKTKKLIKDALEIPINCSYFSLAEVRCNAYACSNTYISLPSLGILASVIKKTTTTPGGDEK